MPKPRTPIGTFGAIGFHTIDGGRVVARTRFRDWDGKLRSVQVTAASSTAAEHRLKVKLNQRQLIQPSFTAITPDSPFGELVDYWLESSRPRDPRRRRP